MFCIIASLESMVIPAGPLAQTFFVMILALTMEQEFGSTISKSLGSILGHVSDSWDNVLIGNLLDMATGHFLFTEEGRDDKENQEEFISASDHDTKLSVAFNSYEQNAHPGTKWVYHGTDTYIVGWALRVLLAKHGAKALKEVEMNFMSYYDSKVLIPLLVSSTMRRSIRTTKDSFLQPISTSGMFLTLHDIVKMSRFINPGSIYRGHLEGTDVLSQKHLNETLQMNPTERGFALGNNTFYHNGMWAYEFNFTHCDAISFVPFAKGEGSSVVALFPNNSTLISISDNDDLDYSHWHEAASEIAKTNCKNVSSVTDDPQYSSLTTSAPTIAPICPKTRYDLLSGSGNTYRTELRAEELFSQESIDLTDLSAFKIPQDASHSQNNFCGTLTLENLDTKTSFEVIHSSPAIPIPDTKLHLPEFSFSFVQHGSHILPTKHGLQLTTHPNWEIIIGAGRVWDEKSDLAWSRASFPFTLVERNNDCTHNGVMSFLFKNGSEISNVAFEIVAETCTSFKANFWGIVSATYDEGFFSPDVDPLEVQSSFELEAAQQIKFLPIQDLETRFFVDAGRFGSQNDVTIHGFDFDGVSYIGGLHTRKGKYPYPGEFHYFFFHMILIYIHF